MADGFPQGFKGVHPTPPTGALSMHNTFSVVIEAAEMRGKERTRLERRKTAGKATPTGGRAR